MYTKTFILDAINLWPALTIILENIFYSIQVYLHRTFDKDCYEAALQKMFYK